MVRAGESVGICASICMCSWMSNKSARRPISLRERETNVKLLIAITFIAKLSNTINA